MWLIYTRSAAPDVAVWPGRRMLAMVDAVAWPFALAEAVFWAPAPTGILGQAVLAACAVSALRRSWVAWTANERYRFTTWTLAVAMAVPLALAVCTAPLRP